MFGLADGYTTYISGIIAILVGLYLVANGNVETGTGYILGGFTVMGFRNKLERIQ